MNTPEVKCGNMTAETAEKKERDKSTVARIRFLTSLAVAAALGLGAYYSPSFRNKVNDPRLKSAVSVIAPFAQAADKILLGDGVDTDVMHGILRVPVSMNDYHHKQYAGLATGIAEELNKYGPDMV